MDQGKPTLKKRFGTLFYSNTRSSLTSKIKTTIIATTTVALLSLGTVYADSNKNDVLSTVYHVYLQGKHVGTVSDKSIVEEIINEKINKTDDGYEEYSFTIGEQITYIPELMFQPIYNNSTIEQYLNNELSVLAESAKITLNGEPVAYVKDMESANAVLEAIKLKYVPKHVLAVLDDSDTFGSAVPQTTSLKPGTANIIDVQFDGKVSITKDKIFPDQILTVDQAVSYIQKGTLEEKIHEVQPGEVLGGIAINFNLSLADILELNPDLTEDSVLQIGQKLNVTDYEPLLDVVVKKEMLAVEEIPFERKVESDSEMYKGESEVRQSGSIGEKQVHYVIITKNNETLSKETVKEEITKNPVTRITAKGTKVVQHRGTGELIWPTVGGRVTSYVGYRWGDYHKGIDIAGVRNRSIKAADNGVVEEAGWGGGYGNKIVINHNNGMKTLYAHLKTINVKVGQTVPKGHVIGIMGNTGNSTGVHLHFEVWKNGKLQNPMSYY